MMTGEKLARLFHETYEELAPNFNYQTRKESAKPWHDVPEQNRMLMIAVAGHVLATLKKQTADDCIEDCAVIDENRDLRKTVSLLNSMVAGGERHSDTSREMVSRSLTPA